MRCFILLEKGMMNDEKRWSEFVRVRPWPIFLWDDWV
ncbi:MAG: hypothetical protein QG657_5530 [Acidobacteriota bacterium]|nr:hypothetical protein [Acidobacteriota bacterium]